MRKLCMALVGAGVSLSVVAAPESYSIDPIHSFVHFEVDHLGGLARIRGRFDKSAGKFVIDWTAKTGSAEVTTQTVSLTTGDSDKGNRPRARDDHLRSPDFFNVVEFPTMTFKSNRIVFSGDNLAELHGNATLLGVTRPVNFKFERWKCMTHPGSKRDICGGILSGSVKRSEFGMKFGIPSVGDEIAVWIGVEGYKD